jgi:hypothetical protein
MARTTVRSAPIVSVAAENFFFAPAPQMDYIQQQLGWGTGVECGLTPKLPFSINV